MYMSANAVSEAEAAYEKSFLLAPDSGILEDWTAVLLKMGDFGKVIDIIEKHQDELTFNSGIDCNLAIAFLNSGKKDEALKILEKSVKKDKENSRINGLLGKLYFENKSYARAQKYLLSASKQEPDNYYWYKALGDLFYDSGDATEAIKYYNMATTIEPNLKIARYLCYEAENYKKEKKYPEAFLKYKLAAKAEPDFAASLMEMGLLCFENNDYEEAVNYLEQALKINPESPETWFHLSKVYEIKSKGFFKKSWKVKAAEAREKYLKLKELSPISHP
jgi:tetratricopeptide (TPR) repeat protein